MFDIQLIVSLIFCAMGMAIFLAMIVLLIDDLHNGYHFTISYIITAIIGIVMFAISLFFVVKYCRLYNSPNVVHERLLNNLDEVEKELQKFYINHPEFKE